MRASKNVNGSTAVFTYDGTKLLTEQTAGQTKTNIHGTNLIATAGSDMLYYQYNNHGDVISVLDQAGEVKNEYDYDAFGNAITEKETVSNPYRYAGYYQDSESGLYYLQSRYYNPRTARFLTEDTASGKYTDPLSLNKYTYCHNQPVTGYDPDGHFLHIVAGAFIGAVVGGAVSAYSQYKSTGKVKLKKTVGAAAKAGSSILGKTIAASAKGGIVGASAGASADLAMQVAKDKKHDIRNVNWKEVGGSALLGGGLGAGIGAVSQTKLGQKVSASQAEWDKKLNAGIDKLKSGFKTCMADNRGSVNLDSIMRKPNSKIYFGQKSVSPNFSEKGIFKGESIQSVSDKLLSGELSSDDLPLEYIVRDGKRITMNNRSLTALSKANMKPTVIKEITGNVTAEHALTTRLGEMGGQPSESIFVRGVKEVVHIADE